MATFFSTDRVGDYIEGFGSWVGRPRSWRDEFQTPVRIGIGAETKPAFLQRIRVRLRDGVSGPMRVQERTDVLHK
jgi:hypothetical protein